MERLRNQEIIEAIKKFRDGNPIERSKAWEALAFTFNFLTTFLFRKFSVLAKDTKDRRIVSAFIDYHFLNTLRATAMRLEQPGFVIKYIAKAMKGKINIASVRHELGMTCDIFFEMEIRWNRASKKFRKAYTHAPDEKNTDDIKKMARLMEIREQELLKFLVSRGKPQSLYAKIGDEDGSELIDILNTHERIHDVDVEAQNSVKFLKERINTILEGQRLQVFNAYYLESFEHTEATKEELARKMGMKFRRFRHLLAEAKHQVVNDETLKHEFVERINA